MEPKVRIACVGGFLGAGKTTALLQAARGLADQGLNVGVITNDQGSHLVDTALVRNSGFQVHEITGGCFCCRFKDFLASIFAMTKRHSFDFIFAEAVGSCADLAATVCRPLQEYYADQFELTPLSILVEPARLTEFSAGAGLGFTESVSYLFRKQLAEADLIVLNKSDLTSPPEIEDLIRKIQHLAGEIPTITTSAVSGRGIDEWVGRLFSPRVANSTDLNLDYEIYGQAEASLGWLNARAEIVSESRFSASEFGEKLTAAIQERCQAADRAIAHLKILLATTEGSDRIALTANQAHSVWTAGGKLSPAREASIVINARVSVDPDTLRQFVESALVSIAREMELSATVQDLESFSPPPPARPQPLRVDGRA